MVGGRFARNKQVVITHGVPDNSSEKLIMFILICRMLDPVVVCEVLSPLSCLELMGRLVFRKFARQTRHRFFPEVI